MSRLALIPFHTTPPALQLDGPARDNADEKLDKAIEQACESVVSILDIGDALMKHTKMSFLKLLLKSDYYCLKPTQRLHRSYAWLTIATFKVSAHSYNIMCMGKKSHDNYYDACITSPYSYWKQDVLVRNLKILYGITLKRKYLKMYSNGR